MSKVVPTNEQKAKAWELAADLAWQETLADDDGRGGPVPEDLKIVHAHMQAVVIPFLRKKASDIRAKPPRSGG